MTANAIRPASTVPVTSTRRWFNLGALTLGALSLWVVVLRPHAQAQSVCFEVAGEPAPRAARLVGLDDTVRLSAHCEYALDASGPWVRPGALAGTATDFAELHRHLADGPGASAAGDPRVVLARPAGRRSTQRETLMLRYCVHYLLEEQLGFRVVPRAGGGSFRLERTHPAACDADALELRAVRGARPERVLATSAEQTLGTNQSSLELTEGDWSIYAARPGGRVGLRVGVFRSQRVVTPLQNHIRTVGLSPGPEPAAPALLAAHWDPEGPGLLLSPTEHALGTRLLWSELRTVADAGLLWVARPEPEGAPRMVGLVQLEATEPPAVRLPDSVVRDHMRDAYGDAGDGLVPTPTDWRAIFDGLAFCLTPNYHDGRTASIGSPVPDADACAALGGLAVFGQTDAAQPAAGRFCIRHGAQVIRADGVEQHLGDPECFALPEATDRASRPPYRMAVAGDRVTVEGEGLCVLVDDQPLVPEEGTGEIVLRSGLLEVRQGGGPGCTSRQAVARLRMPVLDPEREWHPVGLYTGGDEAAMSCGEEEGACPWRALAHDERGVFGYVESRQELDFRLSTSPQVATVVNADRESGVQITHSVPVLGGVSGRFEGAPEPALVAYVSRDTECPNDVAYGELRERPPLDPDALMPDSTFQVHLLSVLGAEDPPQCLARATFRVRPSRALVSETFGDFLGLELGLLGDTQAVFFANEPVALGLALPLVWFRVTPGQRWISFEVAGNLVMAAAFEPCQGCGPELSRVGASLSWALQLGVPEYLPRILSVGGMLNLAADTRSTDSSGMPRYEQPYVSFYVGLNLASLIDLAGGR